MFRLLTVLILAALTLGCLNVNVYLPTPEAGTPPPPAPPTPTNTATLVTPTSEPVSSLGLADMAGALRVVNAMPGVALPGFPTSLTRGPDSRWYATLKHGLVVSFTEAGDVRTEIDYQHRTYDLNEAGMLGVTFGPDGAMWLSYTAPSPARLLLHAHSYVDGEWRGVAVPFQGVKEYAPDRHHGGSMAWGPDGALYIGVGDGGWIPETGDYGGRYFSDNPAQNPESPFGSIVRVHEGSWSVWAKGLRNPWTLAWDGDDLWVADVGADLYEEVNVVQEGRNYGWPVMEGEDCLHGVECDTSLYELPAVSYGHDGETCAVIGIGVYRGEKFPALSGAYLYGDLCLGQVWATRDGETVELLEIPGAGFFNAAFDAAGEPHMVTGSAEGGRILTLDWR